MHVTLLAHRFSVLLAKGFALVLAPILARVLALGFAQVLAWCPALGFAPLLAPFLAPFLAPRLSSLKLCAGQAMAAVALPGSGRDMRRSCDAFCTSEKKEYGASYTHKRRPSAHVQS